MAKRTTRGRRVLGIAAACAALLGGGLPTIAAGGQASAPPLREAALLSDRAARLLARARGKSSPRHTGGRPRQDKGWIDGRGDWHSAKGMARLRLESIFGPLSGRQLRNLRKAKQRRLRPDRTGTLHRCSLRVVRNVLTPTLALPGGQ